LIDDGAGRFHAFDGHKCERYFFGVQRDGVELIEGEIVTG
jgi:hypothetical protein